MPLPARTRAHNVTIDRNCSYKIQFGELVSTSISFECAHLHLQSCISLTV